MTIDEYKCHGDETGWCGQPAAYVVQTLHGQRYACDRCATQSREVTSKEPLGAWLARALGPQGAAMAEEEQRRCREMIGQR